MPALTQHYNCKFCTTCQLPMLKFVRCNRCHIDFHFNCFQANSHKCLSCKYCDNNNCLKSMEEYKSKKSRILKNIVKLPPIFDYKNFKLQKFTTINTIMNMSQNNSDKIEKIQALLGKDAKVYSFDIKNKDSLTEVVTVYSSLYSVTYFMNQLFYIYRCEVCSLGFHASKQNITLCMECRKCYNCEKINIVSGEYLVMQINSYAGNSILVKKILYCIECYNNYVDKNELCPVCNKAYTQEDMVECEWCLRWVHYSCENNKKLLENIIHNKMQKIYKCGVCEIYEGFWVNRLPKNVVILEQNIETMYVFNLTNLNLIYPKCYICKSEFSDVESEIIKLIIVKSKESVFYAHNICAASCSRVENGVMVVEEKNRSCKFCKKANATFKCIYCKNNYFHFNCTFQDHNDLFRSNIMLPICTNHYCENQDKITHDIMRYLNYEYFTNQKIKAKSFQNIDLLVNMDGSFERLIYGNNGNFVLKCDFKHFYLDNIKISANDLLYKLKTYDYTIKLESIVYEAINIHNTKFHDNKRKLQLANYNPCIDTKYQLMNFSMSYISHAIQKNKLIIKNSAIHGKGVFATRFYFPNEIIINYTGESITQEEANQREKMYENLDCYLFKTNQNVIDATFKGNISKFINQSCVPNCYSTEATWGNNTGILICAKSFIAVDEELTYKYGFVDKKMKCKCGLLNCKSKKL